MSLELARLVNAEHPHLLQTNVGATCHQFTLKLIERLRAQGHEAYLMCKSPGEGQYVPPGFQPRDVIGLDGKIHRCSGVSHDAIWSDGKQYDTIAGANDNDQFIYRKSTDPFWSFDPADGQKITGVPIWNGIPQQYWRANNPPLKDGTPIPAPTPVPTPPPVGKPYPGDEVWDAVGVILFADYAAAGQPPNHQMGRWFGRTIWDATEGDAAGVVLTVQESIAKHRREWRDILGLP